MNRMDLCKETLDLLVAESDNRVYAPGTTLMQEEEMGDFMLVIRHGEVDLFSDGTHIETLGAGSILGEMSLIDDAPRSATAVSRTDCQAVRVGRQYFQDLVQRRPSFALEVMSVMARRLRKMNER